jgi:hypothetical protein
VCEDYNLKKLKKSQKEKLKFFKKTIIHYLPELNEILNYLALIFGLILNGFLMCQAK